MQEITLNHLLHILASLVDLLDDDSVLLEIIAETLF